MPRHGHGETESFTLQESVELERLRREGHHPLPYISVEPVREWIQEHRLRWAKEGHPDYQHLLSKP